MSEIQEHIAVLQDAQEMLSLRLEPAIFMLLRTLAEGGKILTCGNGGSAAQASHLAAELTVRFLGDRRAMAAVSLSADAVAITACGNDYGFDRIFSRQVEAIGQPGDCLVAFSTSGTSKNVCEALAVAHKKGMGVLGISGRKGFPAHTDVDLIVPSQSTARIQELHLLIVHLLLSGIEKGIPR
jgi:D-sedoheptulose 7-phosphate isomerase